MKLRGESWGAWARVEVGPPIGSTLVALDHRALDALGIGEPARPAHAGLRPLEVHMAVNARCGAGCDGCYLDAVPDGGEVPLEAVHARLDELVAQDVFTVAFGGGEPTLRADLGEIAKLARARGLSPVVTTSGLGLSPRKVAELAEFDQVNVSLDGVGDAYRQVRGFDGSDEALRAVRALAAHGVRVGINLVMTRATFAEVERTIDRAYDAGAVEVQLLRYKPSGRAATSQYLERRLEAEQVLRVPALLRRLVEAGRSVRIDCSLVPFLSSDASLYEDPERIARFGVFGCEAGEALLAVRADGRIAGCSFADATDARSLVDAASDPELEGWRERRAAPREPCASCNLRPICKGGCAVVAQFIGGAHGPDPECPRVRATLGEPVRRLPVIHEEPS